MQDEEAKRLIAAEGDGSVVAAYFEACRLLVDDARESHHDRADHALARLDSVPGLGGSGVPGLAEHRGPDEMEILAYFGGYEEFGVGGGWRRFVASIHVRRAHARLDQRDFELCRTEAEVALGIAGEPFGWRPLFYLGCALGLKDEPDVTGCRRRFRESSRQGAPEWAVSWMDRILRGGPVP